MPDAEQSTAPAISPEQAADIERRVTAFEQDLPVLMATHQLKGEITMNFPKYNILPDEVMLALKVIEKHGRIFVYKYTDLKGGGQ
jgi:hypothetical protein